MNKYTLALLVGCTQSTKLSWPVEENQDADFLVKERKMETQDLLQLEKHIHTRAPVLAQVSSSSKWIELPDCSRFFDAGGVFDVTQIQLKDDLTNAIIATCKGPIVAWVPPVPQVYSGAAADATGSNWYHPRVYDDKVAGTQFPNLIPDSEHQIQQSGNGTVSFSGQNVGPQGSFFNQWNYPYQSKDTQWDFTGATDPWTPVPLPVNPVAWIGATP